MLKQGGLNEVALAEGIVVSAQSSSDGYSGGITVAVHEQGAVAKGLADTMAKAADIGAKSRLSSPDTLPVALRLAIAAGLKVERSLPGAASSARRARDERALIGGLIRTLKRGRRSLPDGQI